MSEAGIIIANIIYKAYRMYQDNFDLDAFRKDGTFKKFIADIVKEAIHDNKEVNFKGI